MSDAVNGFKPKKVVQVLRHDDHNDIVIVLEDEQSIHLALVLTKDMAVQLQSTILTNLPQGDGEEFGTTLADDLAAVERIDHVNVSSDIANPTKFELDFQVNSPSAIGKASTSVPCSRQYGMPSRYSSCSPSDVTLAC